MTSVPAPRPDEASDVESTDRLLMAAIEATRDLEDVAPELVPCRVLAYRDSLPPGIAGAVVPVVGGRRSFYLAVLCDDHNVVAIARSVVPTCEASPDIPRMRAALREVCRVVAQGLRLRLGERGALVGEPMFVEGVVKWKRHAGLRAAEVVLGRFRVTLVVATRMTP